MRFVVGLLAMLALTASACVSDGAGEAQTPPPETSTRRMSLNPTNPLPGSEFLVGFDLDNERGGYFYLHAWQDGEWTERIYVLESDAKGGSPTAIVPADDTVILDYGIAGPGPDGLVLPEPMEPGHWRICTANSRENLCARFMVGIQGHDQ